MQNSYLSGRALTDYSFSTLFCLPYCESLKNAKKAVSCKTSKIAGSCFSVKGIVLCAASLERRMAHLIAAAALATPLVNTITLLFLRLFSTALPSNEVPNPKPIAKEPDPEPIDLIPAPLFEPTKKLDPSEVLNKILLFFGNDFRSQNQVVDIIQMIELKGLFTPTFRKILDKFKTETPSVLPIELLISEIETKINHPLTSSAQSLVTEMYNSVLYNFVIKIVAYYSNNPENRPVYESVMETIKETKLLDDIVNDMINQSFMNLLPPFIEREMRLYIQESQPSKKREKAAIDCQKIKFLDYLYGQISKKMIPIEYAQKYIEGLTFKIYIECFSLPIIDRFRMRHPLLPQSEPEDTSQKNPLLDQLFADLKKKFGKFDHQPEIAQVALNHFIKTFVFQFLEPYFCGEITANNEPINRISLMEFFMDQLPNFVEEMQMENLEDLLYDEYIKQSIYGLYRYILSSMYENAASYEIEEKNDEYPEGTPEFDQLIKALRVALPKDFPDRMLSEDEDFRLEVAEILKQVNKERYFAHEEDKKDLALHTACNL